MKTLIITLGVLTLSSCAFTSKLTDDQLVHRNKIDYELDKLWADYQYKSDSLLIEYYKHK
jgi:hypothetical protein